MQPTASPARPYKDFLTPLLHRRFTHAAALALGLSYTYSVLLSPSSSLLWRLLPFGMTGLRTLLLCLPVLAVFIVRVMNMHIGRSTATSAAERVVQKLLDSRTAGTLFWYAFSAWFFGEVYIWTRTESANLGWIDYGMSYERPRVNENPVLLRCIWLCLAGGQAVLHLVRDEDRVGIEETEDRQLKVKAQGEESQAQRPILLLFAQAHVMVGRTVKLVGPGIIFSIPVMHPARNNAIRNNGVNPV